MHPQTIVLFTVATSATVVVAEARPGMIFAEDSLVFKRQDTADCEGSFGEKSAWCPDVGCFDTTSLICCDGGYFCNLDDTCNSEYSCDNSYGQVVAAATIVKEIPPSSPTQPATKKNAAAAVPWSMSWMTLTLLGLVTGICLGI